MVFSGKEIPNHFLYNLISVFETSCCYKNYPFSLLKYFGGIKLKINF